MNTHFIPEFEARQVPLLISYSRPEASVTKAMIPCHLLGITRSQRVVASASTDTFWRLSECWLSTLGPSSVAGSTGQSNTCATIPSSLKKAE
jgi:hypothetical protein